MPESHEQHQAALLAAFARVVRAEGSISAVKSRLADATIRMKVSIAEGEIELAAAWASIAALMAETGETEVTLPGTATDYRIGWSTPRESVAVTDAAAVPDDFVEVERKPKLKEIGEHLRLLRDHQNTAWPNWARLEEGGRKLAWKAVKRK